MSKGVSLSLSLSDTHIQSNSKSYWLTFKIYSKLIHFYHLFCNHPACGPNHPHLLPVLLQWPLAGLTAPLLPAAPTPAFCLFSTAESKMSHEVSHRHHRLAQISPLLPAHFMGTPSFTVRQLPWLLGAVAGEWQDCPPPLRFCHQPSLCLEHFPDIPITHFLQGYLMPSPQQYVS